MKDKNCTTKGCKGMIDSNMNKSGLCGRCATKKWMIENPERFYKLTRECYLRDKDKFDKIKKDHYLNNKQDYKDKAKRSYEENKEEIAKRHLAYANRRYREDESFRIRKQLGSALSMVVRGYIKTGKVRNPMRKFDIDWEGIIKVLSPIPKDRNKYQIDHIIPLYKFDLSQIEQVRIAFAPENHRWLLAKENQGRDRS